MFYICIYNYGVIVLQSKNVKATSIWSNYDNTPKKKSKSPTLLSAFCSGKIIC